MSLVDIQHVCVISWSREKLFVEEQKDILIRQEKFQDLALICSSEFFRFVIACFE